MFPTSLAEIRLTSSTAPLKRQLYRQLRGLILQGRLTPGTRLPATRVLAESLDVSRNTVVAAYEQLAVEGFLTARVGSGTRVSENLPGWLPARRGATAGGEASGGNGPRAAPTPLSSLGRRLVATSLVPELPDHPSGAFRPGAVAPELFPHDLWARLAGRALREHGPAHARYGDPMGWPPFRKVVASYLTAVRGVDCDQERIAVTAGSQQALDILARILVDPGDPVGLEDPCYPGARAAFEGAGARLRPMEVDEQGVVTPGPGEEPPLLLYVTPSHQYPMGVTMSASRRLELLKWAAREGVWIVEDDYDGEFRYETHPLQALQGMDRNGRVLYVGTFSKISGPGLRLGYVVLPDALVEPFRRARAMMDHHPPLLGQLVMERFMGEGHLGRHIRRMRNAYRERRDALVRAIRERLDPLVVPEPGAGLHLLARLAGGIRDRQVAVAALEEGIVAPSLSDHRIRSHPAQGLVLGFGAVPPGEAPEAVDALARAVERVRRR